VSEEPHIQLDWQVLFALNIALGVFVAKYYTMFYLAEKQNSDRCPTKLEAALFILNSRDVLHVP